MTPHTAPPRLLPVAFAFLFLGLVCLAIIAL